MADWYCSSVAWTAVTAWSAALTATTGMIRRQSTTPTVGNERVWVCTTGGTTGGSEPSWTLTKASTTTDNGVVWTECTGNSTHQQDNGVTNSWAAPHARLENAISWMANGDRCFLSSDHTQTKTGSSVTFASPGSGCFFISVNRTTGNIPPLAADITTGAAVSITAASFGNLTIQGEGDWSGVSFTVGTGTDNFIGLAIGATQGKYRWRNCTFAIGGSGANNSMSVGGNVVSRQRFDNPTFNFAGSSNLGLPGNSGAGRFFMSGVTFGGTLPATLIGLNGSAEIEIHASDLSNLTSSQTLFAGGSTQETHARLLNCKLSSGMHIVSMTNNLGDQLHVDVMNCDSGATGYRNEWHTAVGDITTETTITRSGGATDGVQTVSHKWVSTSNATLLGPVDGPVLWAWNSATGSSLTATVEIQSGATLNNDDIWLELEYLGSSSFPISTLSDTSIATPLTTHAAVTTSVATWNSSVGSPIYQKLVVTFTPQLVGLVAGRVRLAKASQTVYVDPKITIT